ncbi:hypothetical protein GJU39_22365 [Pedobacter petrophilus]|uniref:YD repeat-containing protein n=1 Tax=Pedobacter petrophilus TaxID=1908241 RepID=A0A7K0G656_9SPHI|nr:hypothetical protein [Pedobacter petrophilus]MRX78824.1 hypothetical protein [Pedobacter petrophilus]
MKHSIKSKVVHKSIPCTSINPKLCTILQIGIFQLFLAITTCSFAFGQTSQTKVNFSTPEVTAFNRSIETPVSLYTGVPSISIPLYEINIKGVSVPVTLDYHAGGIRVDQEATWVGLGWTLNYGGEISRKVRGIADELFYLNTNTVSQFMNLPTKELTPNPDAVMRVEKVQSAKYGKSDLMPDEFYYSVLGYSGKFIYSQAQNKFIMFPKEDIDVQKRSTLYKDADLYQWDLKLPNGVSVDFGKEGYSASQIPGIARSVRNSWQIKSIRNNFQDSIVYNYENFNYYTLKMSGSYYKFDTQNGHSSGTDLSYINMLDSRLKTINFPGGRIELLTVAREDMPSEALSEIKIFDANNVLIKNIKFNYSYFFGDAFNVLPILNFADIRTSDNYQFKRLKLESVDIVADNKEPLKYAFDYYTTSQMPSKYTFSQDHYGFYNAIDNNRQNGFIPTLENYYTGGDRRVKAESSKTFSLKSVTYPEKGKTEFIYEGNSSGVMNIPGALLANYQDDNFLEKYAAISVSSYSRNTSYPSPDETRSGVRYFRKQFTVGDAGYTDTKKNFIINTNFGISSLEAPLPFFANNVEFKLERINPDNSRFVVQRFNTTESNYNGSGSSPRKGVYEQMVGLSFGNYEMTVAITYANQPNTPADNQPYNLSFFIKWREMDPNKKAVSVGGLRVKNINYFDNNNTLVKTKSFSYVNPDVFPSVSNYTSGQVISFPQYFENRLRKIYGQSQRPDYYAWISYFSSNSILPLETTSGSVAGYEYVDELDMSIGDQSQAFKTRSHFSFDRPYFSQFHANTTKGLLESKEWTRGKLLDRSFFRDNQIIKKEVFDYYIKSPHLQNVEDEDYVEEVNTNLISFQELNYACQCSTDFPEDFYDTDGGRDNCVYYYYSPFNNHIITTAGKPVDGIISGLTCDMTTKVPYFKISTGFDKLKSKITTLFDNLQTPSIYKEEYSFEGTPVHHQLTKQSSSNSKEISTETVFKYPQDLMLSGSEEQARQELIKKHQIDIKLSQNHIANGSEDLSKTEFYYNSSTGIITPRFSMTNSGNNGSLEIRQDFSKFDYKGNLQEVSTKLGAKTVYLYSYNYQYPIAEIKNADYQSVETILGGPTNINNIAAANPTNVEIVNWINLLRNSPNLKDAHISSYTYKPLVGMTSQTDPKGMTTYYEYDEFQRLKNVKDQNGNILKNSTYHYKN